MSARSLTLLPLLPVLAVLLALFAAPQAGAQIIQFEEFQTDEPPFSLRPDDEAAPTSSPSQSGRGRLESDPPAADHADPDRMQLVPLRAATLRPEGVGPVMRFNGEVVTERFILFLPADPGQTELRLAHRTGIDALPERSSLRVSVNGNEIQTLVPDNFVDFGQDVIDVPEGVLHAGRNSVEITARHTHRVACGPDAAFALWSEIDTANSGVPVPARDFEIGPIGFLAAIAAQTAQQMPVVIRRPDPEASLLAAAPFIGQIASLLGGAPPRIESAPFWALEGPMPEAARITALAPGQGLEGPRFERGGDGAIVLMVEQTDDFGPISDGLLAAVGDLPASGAATLTPGRAQPLSALGAGRLQGEGRYIRLAVDFALPWDWLLLASQKARLDLDYRFAPGLPQGALLLVKVNGTTVRLLPLDRDGGPDMPTLPISFEARLLHPGANRIEFEALVPGDPPDAACAPMERAVLDISAASQIYVPQSPQMWMPSIDRALSRMTGWNIHLTQSAEAALPPGLAPQLAAALMIAQPGAGRDDPSARLSVGTMGDLERMDAPLPPASRRALADSLSRQRLQPSATEPGTTRWELIEAPGDRGLFSGLEQITDLPERVRQAAIRMVRGDAPALEDWLATHQGQAALLQPDPARPDDIWLIFGPFAEPSTIAGALAASQGSRSGPEGQLALYVAGEGWVSWADPQRPLHLSDGVTPGNIRAVLGNHATVSPLSFLALILSLTAISALLALAILVTTRRRAGQ
ncbi:MAG: cellulose biosynthesis cyclic di-GMP-binding regulatory protein BcsB [Pararhodobacter sp.]|nr:cellulose biosynthesis cyclic di-GMP-binding regulatory protein BcsB [Pararhodobacter sp.]